MTADAAKERLRFEQELEFVASLANPHYLHFLAQRLYFEDERFLAYVKYLSYWQTPEYSRFVMQPNALEILGLLESSAASRTVSPTTRATREAQVVAMVRETQRDTHARSALLAKSGHRSNPEPCRTA